MALFVAMFGMIFVACSDDDDDNGGSRIVGTWYSNNHYYGATSTFKFMSNGTYHLTFSGTNSSWFEDEEGRYSYEEKSGILVLVNRSGTTWYYFITNITDSYFTFMDEDGYVYTYYRK